MVVAKLFLKQLYIIHKEYKNVSEKKSAKGTGYIIIIPTQTSDTGIVSSSLIRKFVNENQSLDKD